MIGVYLWHAVFSVFEFKLILNYWINYLPQKKLITFSDIDIDLKHAWNRVYEYIGFSGLVRLVAQTSWYVSIIIMTLSHVFFPLITQRDWGLSKICSFLRILIQMRFNNINYLFSMDQLLHFGHHSCVISWLYHRRYFLLTALHDWGLSMRDLQLSQYRPSGASHHHIPTFQVVVFYISCFFWYSGTFYITKLYKGHIKVQMRKYTGIRRNKYSVNKIIIYNYIWDSSKCHFMPLYFSITPVNIFILNGSNWLKIVTSQIELSN